MTRVHLHIRKDVVLAVILGLAALSISGCPRGGIEGRSVVPGPRSRIGRYASPSIGTVFDEPNNIGKHGYLPGGSEKRGIVYTCKAGHIDLAHMRKSADWTAYLYWNFAERMKKKATTLSFKFREPTRYHIELTYPGYWDEMPQEERDAIIKDVAIRLAEYSAYTGTMWHEMLTWFGFRSTGFYPEFPSAFAWEDTFSDLFGTHIAAKALRDTEHDYDEAMTLALDRELVELGAQPKRVAVRASKSVSGQWFSGDFLFLINMKVRNFDIGIDDGYITPFLVPELAECEGAEPHAYPVPNLESIGEHGFDVKFELEPREAERKKIFRVLWPERDQWRERLVPTEHFAMIMDYIVKDAVENHGFRTTPDFVVTKVEPSTVEPPTPSADMDTRKEGEEPDPNDPAADMDSDSAEGTSGDTHAE